MKLSMKRQILKTQTSGSNRRPKLLQKMGRDLDNFYIGNQETYGLNLLKREQVRLYAGRESAEVGWQLEGGECYCL